MFRLPAKPRFSDVARALARAAPALMPACRALLAPTLVGLSCIFLLAQDTPVIRVNVNLVHILATVKTTKGELVGSLGKDDFEVYDNGVKQEIAHFQRQTDQPLSVALMIDVSGSTAKDLGLEMDSATKFLHALLAEGRPDDRVALYSFDDTVRVEQPYSHNFTLLTNALRKIHGSAGTSLYDAITLVSQDLERRQGRKVMVVVSDGGETTSRYTSHDALKALQMADAVIYPVVVLPVMSDSGRNTGGENFFKWIAPGTGGRAFFPQLSSELDRTFSQIIDDLRTQYSIGFYPHNVPLTKDPWHKLEVIEKSGKLQVSARNGYYGESETYSAASKGTSVDGDIRTKKKKE
ncbi:MAG TPA: VWA domain-containing protein [Verrucomicrobiae bacterium]|nr:VWA domain-containing protein [Verrucomicrobiae bacterium]